MIITNNRKTPAFPEDFPMTKGDLLIKEESEIFKNSIFTVKFLIEAAFFLMLEIISGHSSLCAQNKYTELQKLKEATSTDTLFKGFIFPAHDSILHINMKTIEMIAPYHCKNKRDLKKYDQLEKDVLKTYPLALIVSSEIHVVDAEFENSYADQSKRKKYIKWYEKYVYKTYIDSVKTLNIQQGRLLLKLIHRETGKTPYHLIKSYRGGLNALFWQSLAFMAGSNLNIKYNPEDNVMIENIIQRYKSGEFN